MDELADRIEDALATAGSSLTVGEIAERVGVSAHDVDRLIWGDPDRFVWQPGHRWTNGVEKARPSTVVESRERVDARESPLAPRERVELRAVVLESGVTLKVTRRSMDTHAFFAVRSVGNTVELVLNSSHELFGEMPMPFEGAASDAGYRRLVELLLEAWALYEDSVIGGSSRRAAEDTRLLWGRRILELLREDNGTA